MSALDCSGLAAGDGIIAVMIESSSGGKAAGVLIIFGGLPGTGKTTLAREVARRLGGVYLRIDSIEQALRDSGAIAGMLDDAGYRAAYAVAEDNLRLGCTVDADSVNPLRLTRDAWLSVATRAKARAVEVEVTCPDVAEHRRRVEGRIIDIAGLRPPTWEEVVTRQYEGWDREHLVIDTATTSVADSVEAILGALRRELPDVRR